MRRRIPILQVFCMLVVYDKVKAVDMARIVGCCKRHIYRIVTELKEAGVPIETSKGNGGGISIVKTGHNISRMYEEIIGE